MLLLLFSLIQINIRLGNWVSPQAGAAKLFLHLPFSVYLGWISVATIANTAAFLTSIGWDGYPMKGGDWAGLMIIIAGVLGYWMATIRKDIAYGLVILWALWGIYKGQPDPTGVFQMGLVLAPIGIISGFIVRIVKGRTS